MSQPVFAVLNVANQETYLSIKVRTFYLVLTALEAGSKVRVRFGFRITVSS